MSEEREIERETERECRAKLSLGQKTHREVARMEEHVGYRKFVFYHTNGFVVKPVGIRDGAEAYSVRRRQRLIVTLHNSFGKGKGLYRR